MCFFSIGTQWSRELVPVAAEAGAVCIDKSAAFRLQDGVPLVVPEVNGERALENRGIIANPNCCTIPLTMVLAPLHDAAGLRSVRVATYQSVSGAGSDAIADLRAEDPEDHLLRMDWEFDGVGVRRGSEATRRDAEDPRASGAADQRRHASACRSSSATQSPSGSRRSHRSRPAEAERILAGAPGIQLENVPSHGHAIGSDDVIVGRIRADLAGENGLTLFLMCDNLRKGAALNAIQIAELLVGASLPSYFGQRAS